MEFRNGLNPAKCLGFLLWIKAGHRLCGPRTHFLGPCVRQD